MEPFYTLSDFEHDELLAVLEGVTKHPYADYPSFSQAVADLIDRGEVPEFFTRQVTAIREERADGKAEAHVLRNCPIDREIPVLDHDDPVTDKHAKKHTFVGEALLELFNRIAGTPLLAYARNRGDFFTDVIAINRYSGKFTGYSDSELYYHNDRTAHPVRADYISLLGLRSPEGDFVYTGFIDGRELLRHLSEQEQRILREPYFVTPFDVFSRDTNSTLTTSDVHPILERAHSFRYMDTLTAVAPGSPEAAKDAFIALKNAQSKAERVRHRILTRDLLVLANQDGLHSRERVEIHDAQRAKSRWLLKTYAFADDAAADRHAHRWIDGVRGRVAD